MNKLNQQLKEEMTLNKINAQKLASIQKLLGETLASLKPHTEAVTSTLSCLSCLQYLKCGPGSNMPMPLTLLCGHSICSKCFRMHSDPKSADSLVFCEECKIETKNKSLKESKFIGDICSGFGKVMAAIESLQKGTEAL